MRIQLSALLFMASLTITTTLAKPLPSDFHDVERRWSQGYSEVCLASTPSCYVMAWFYSLARRAEIHATHSIRDATPAWPVSRAVDAGVHGGFALTTDERTLQGRSERKRDDGLWRLMHDFVVRFMASQGEAGMIGARAEDEAPVLRPMRGKRYQFTA